MSISKLGIFSAIVIFPIGAALLTPLALAAAPAVTTPQGIFPAQTYAGVAKSGITDFLGIRFAAPPVGLLDDPPALEEFELPQALIASADRANGNSRTLHMPGLRLANKLLQAMTVRRHHAAVAARRHGDLADVQVAVRIRPHVMRGEEIAHGTRIRAATPTGQELAAAVEDTQARADGMGARSMPRKQTRPEADLRHEHVALDVDEHLHRPGHVGPLGQELAGRREDLNPAVLPVGHVDALVPIQGNAVRQVELRDEGPQQFARADLVERN